MKLALGLLLALAPTLAQATQAKDLGDLGGGQSFARSLNEGGLIVGDSRTSSGETHAFLYSNNQIVDLGTIGGNYSSANAVSNRGQVAGTSYLPGAQPEPRAVIWDHGQTIILPHLNGSSNSQANGINDAEHVVGSSGNVATIWENRQPRSLGTLGGSNSYANAISQNGLVVGNSVTAQGQWHAFLYRNNQMIDLGTLGGSTSAAYGVNDRGQVVGSSETANGSVHAFVWENGVMQDLGTINNGSSIAQAISAGGLIAGQGLVGNNVVHTLKWDWNSQLIDIGAATNDEYSAGFGINNSGKIAGIRYVNGTARATLWE
ncbi:MAG: HAF repeat-containing protein [Bdellovibrionota bacterium]